MKPGLLLLAENIPNECYRERDGRSLPPSQEHSPWGSGQAWGASGRQAEHVTSRLSSPPAPNLMASVLGSPAQVSSCHSGPALAGFCHVTSGLYLGYPACCQCSKSGCRVVGKSLCSNPAGLGATSMAQQVGKAQPAPKEGPEVED